MGTTNSKKVDNAGEVINNITVQDVVQIENKQIIFLLVAILLVLILNLILKIYLNHRRGLRKKYLSSPARVAVLDSKF